MLQTCRSLNTGMGIYETLVCPSNTNAWFYTFFPPPLHLQEWAMPTWIGNVLLFFSYGQRSQLYLKICALRIFLCGSSTTLWMGLITALLMQILELIENWWPDWLTSITWFWVLHQKCFRTHQKYVTLHSIKLLLDFICNWVLKNFR